jgi:hypothetical protein
MSDPHIVVVAVGRGAARLLLAIAILDRHDAAGGGGNDAIGLRAFDSEEIHTPARAVCDEIVEDLNHRAIGERQPV